MVCLCVALCTCFSRHHASSNTPRITLSQVCVPQVPLLHISAVIYALTSHIHLLHLLTRPLIIARGIHDGVTPFVASSRTRLVCVACSSALCGNRNMGVLSSIGGAIAGCSERKDRSTTTQQSRGYRGWVSPPGFKKSGTHLCQQLPKPHQPVPDQQ